ncbi:hypothetical protein EDC94DRAFT_556305 [Helicostylum pulchrum]|nr:hypothetical protein EDC94DRAFT_556305 [Helicostylum pulchrum]
MFFFKKKIAKHLTKNVLKAMKEKKKKKQEIDGLIVNQRYYKKNVRKLAAKAVERTVLRKKKSTFTFLARQVFLEQVRDYLFLLNLRPAFGSARLCIYRFVQYYVQHVLNEIGDREDVVRQLLNAHVRLFPEEIPHKTQKRKELESELFTAFESHNVTLTSCLEVMLAFFEAN